jgi:hypothetical protein
MTSKTPAIVELLARLLLWSEQEARLFWWGVRNARWSETCSFRQELLWAASYGAPRHVAERIVTPQRLILVLEALVREKLLKRREVVQLEEAVLQHTDQGGQWR